MINKTEHCWRQPRKDTKKNLTATPFSYINDISDDSNEVCLHITYLFLKALVFVSNITPLVIQQSPLLYSAIYSFVSFFLSVYLFYCHCWYIFFQIDRLEPSFTDSVFRFRFRDSVSGFRIPCFSAAADIVRWPAVILNPAQLFPGWLDITNN